MRVICAYVPQSGRPDAEKVRFYDEMGSEWDLGSCREIIVSLGDFNGHEDESWGFDYGDFNGHGTTQIFICPHKYFANV